MKPGRVATVLVMLGALLVSALTRDAARAMQQNVAAAGQQASRANLSGMNSFALALLLGGLRGPLVMVLWATSESQKVDRDLEDFDTKIEWIRLLQPEFDTVHIYQIWNKAYNVSAQMVSLGNKYVSILEAIDYARSVDLERPQDLNILYALSQVYSHKLGSSNVEKEYYQRRVREETLPHKPRQRAKWGEPGFDRVEHDIMLGEDFNLLPSLVRPVSPRPSNLTATVSVPVSHWEELLAAARQAGVTIPAGVGPAKISPQETNQAASNIPTDDATAASTAPTLVSTPPISFALPEEEAAKLDRASTVQDARFSYADWNTGAEQQYLPKYGPYPYGLSPFAMGFNDAKRAQVLMTLGHQKPLQLGPAVIDRSPALQLKSWAEGEWERGRRLEIKALGLQAPLDRIEMEKLTAPYAIDQPLKDESQVKAMLYSYDLSARLCRDGLVEYERHLSKPEYLNSRATYQSNLDYLNAQGYLVSADRDYFATRLASGPERERLVSKARENYENAKDAYQRIVLQYYVDDAVIRRLGSDKLRVGQLSRRQRDDLYAGVKRFLSSPDRPDQFDEDRLEFDQYVSRSAARLHLLSNPVTKPVQ